MQVNNYRLFLYRPQAANIAITGSYPTEYNNQFLGELKVFDLKLDLKLQDISTITFKVPENIGATINSRLFQLLEFFIVELWYGNLEGTVDVDYFRYRFIINKNPLSYSDGQKSYEYSGSSLEYSLEFKNIFNWPGILIRDFYRSIVYTSGTPSTFTEVAAVGVTLTPYSILESTNTIKTKYITVPTTTADEENIDPPSTFDIFIYQHKRNSDDSVNSENSIIEYSGSVSDENFKNGFYIPVLNEDGKVIAINIAIPNDITNFDAADKFFELRLYDNPVSRHFAVGINTDEEIKASDMYLDLAHSDKTVFYVSLSVVSSTSYTLFVAKSSPNVNKLYPGQELKDESTILIYPTGTKILEIDRTTDPNFVYITVSDLPNNLADIDGLKSFKVISKNIEYLDYTFSVQTVYSKNGLKLEHILLGTQETRDEDDEIQNSKLTIEGLIYDTDFTIGEIHPIIAAKYRSNIELNNITKYQAIKDIAETFDSIPVFDSIKRTVSFYPDKNEDVFTNNGLIITERNYLKNLNNNIDSTKIVTKGYGIGKDNMGVELITPNGDSAWEDYSYFLDTYYVEFDKDNILEDMSFNSTNGLTFSSFPEGGLSRWMTSTEALALSKWQYRRDYFHNVMLGELDPLITEHEKYYNLYNLRSESINNFVKEESKYYEIKATEYNYKFLYEKFVNQNSNLTDEQRRNKTFLYNYSNTTTEANPGLGIFRLNSNNFETVTKIIINNKDSNDIFRTTFLTTLNAQNNPRIILTGKTDLENGLPTNFISYNVKGRVTFTDYVVIDVVFISKTQSGSMFANTNQVYLQFKTWEEIYKEKYDAAVVNSAISLSNINQLHYKIYNNRIDGTIAKTGDEDFDALSTISQSSFATLILEVQSFLNKENNNIDLNSLKPFIREAVMNDSKIDNELDLIIALQEFVLEHSKPIVTLDIGIADFLASEDLRQFWNKVKIGEVVNIYFKDFNVDTTAQLREISIDFQSNTLNFVISTYRHYGRAPLNWMLRQIRYMHNNEYNKYTYYNDKNNDTSNKSDDVTTIIKPGGSGFDAGDTGFNFGSPEPESEEEEKSGDSSGKIGPEGILTFEVVVDPVLESFSINKDKKIQIANGSLIASSYVEADNPFISEVEVSGDNGFVIRKKQIINEELSVTKQMYIDTDGNAIFAGALSAATGTFAGELSAATGSFTGSITATTGNIGGFTIGATTLTAGGTGQAIGISPSTGTNISFYAGAAVTSPALLPNTEEIDAAPFTVSKTGALKSTSGTIAGWSIQQDRILSINATFRDPGGDSGNDKTGRSIVGPGYLGVAETNLDGIIPASSLYYILQPNGGLAGFLNTSNPLNSVADTYYRIDGIDSKDTFSINTSNTHAVLALSRGGSSFGTVVLDTSLITPAGSIVTQKFPNASGTFALLQADQTFTGNITISGNLTVNGTTTNLNTTNLLIEDKNIVLGDVNTPSDTTANGGGFTLKGATDKTIIWYNDNNAWEFNQGIEVVGNGISLNPGQSLKLSGISDGTHRIFHDASTDYDVVEYSTGFQLRHFTSGNQLTLTGSNGRVGIGTITPAELLEVNGNVRGTRFISTATGTAPMTVASTTVVANLNADLLDGNEASAFALVSPIMDTKTANYTLALTDAGKVLRVNSSSALFITIPANSTVAIPINTEIAIIRYGTGSVSIIPVGVTVTLNSFLNYQRIKDRYTSAALKKIDTNEWILVGNLGA
jgi:hypothetical protein